MKLIKMGAFLAALALAVIATSVAPALSANSWEDCTKGTDVELVINACTEVIAEGRETSQELAQAYHRRCLANNDKGDYDRAIADCSKAIELDPKFSHAYSTRCWTRAIMGQVQQALADCNESLKLDPNNNQALSALGFAYLKLGEYDQAIATYDVAVKAEPEHAHSLYGRGIAKLKKGDSSGNEDIAAAKAIAPDIAEEFARYGVK